MPGTWTVPFPPPTQTPTTGETTRLRPKWPFDITGAGRPAGSDDAVLIDAVGFFARSVDGRPTLIARTDEAGCGEGESAWLALHDLATGEEQRFSCAHGGGDSTWHVTDVGNRRYVASWAMDLANHSTMGGLTIGETGTTDPPATSGLDLPGNPYPDAPSCRVLQEGEPQAACEVRGRLLPDGLLLATWYRPDYMIVVPPQAGLPPEFAADDSAWLARFDTVPAELRVTELDTGTQRYLTELPARSRLVEFDGRFVVTSPRCPVGTANSCDDGSGIWMIIDTSGRPEDLGCAQPAPRRPPNNPTPNRWYPGRATRNRRRPPPPKRHRPPNSTSWSFAPMALARIRSVRRLPLWSPGSPRCSECPSSSTRIRWCSHVSGTDARRLVCSAGRRQDCSSRSATRQTVTAD